MSYLQNYLNTITERADKEIRRAHANAALVELAGDIMARINACGERDVVFPTHHLYEPADGHWRGRSSVTLQKCYDATNDELLDALDAAGFPVCHLPARVERNRFNGKREVFLLIVPGVELVIEPPLPRNAAGSPAANAAETHEEALPCAA